MTAHVKDLTAGRGDQSNAGNDDAMLAELRSSLSAIAKDLAAVAESRAKAAAETAQAGTVALKRSIRRQPVVAVGVATLAGALLALLVVPRAPRRRSSSWSAWSPPVSRADLEDLYDRAQRSVSRAASSVPLTPAFERLVEALSKVEPQASLSSVLEKAGSWFRRAQSAAMPDKK